METRKTTTEVDDYGNQRTIVQKEDNSTGPLGPSNPVTLPRSAFRETPSRAVK